MPPAKEHFRTQSKQITPISCIPSPPAQKTDDSLISQCIHGSLEARTCFHIQEKSWEGSSQYDEHFPVSQKIPINKPQHRAQITECADQLSSIRKKKWGNELKSPNIYKKHMWGRTRITNI